MTLYYRTDVAPAILAACVGLLLAGCSSSSPKAAGDVSAASSPSPVSSLAATPTAPAPSTSPPEAPASPCQVAFTAAAKVSNGQDTVSDLSPAFAACRSVAEFATASKAAPGAIDPQIEPKDYAATACANDPAVKASALCASLR